MERLTPEIFKRYKGFNDDTVKYLLSGVNNLVQKNISDTCYFNFTPEIINTIDSLVAEYSEQIISGTYIDNGIYYVFFTCSAVTDSNRAKFYNQSVQLIEDMICKYKKLLLSFTYLKY